MLPALFLGIVLLVGRGDGGDDPKTLHKNGSVSAADILTYRKAAEQGDAEAQFNLGLCHYNGYGVAKDDVIAYMWFTSCRGIRRRGGKKQP